MCPVGVPCLAGGFLGPLLPQSSRKEKGKMDNVRGNTLSTRDLLVSPSSLPFYVSFSAVERMRSIVEMCDTSDEGRLMY